MLAADWSRAAEGWNKAVEGLAAAAECCCMAVGLLADFAAAGLELAAAAVACTAAAERVAAALSQELVVVAAASECEVSAAFAADLSLVTFLPCNKYSASASLFFSSTSMSRVDIWRDQCERRSRNFFVTCVNLLGKKCKMLYDSNPKYGTLRVVFYAKFVMSVQIRKMCESIYLCLTFRSFATFMQNV